MSGMPVALCQLIQVSPIETKWNIMVQWGFREIPQLPQEDSVA
jgi:hypothetical protein